MNGMYVLQFCFEYCFRNTPRTCYVDNRICACGERSTQSTEVALEARQQNSEIKTHSLWKLPTFDFHLQCFVINVMALPRAMDRDRGQTQMVWKRDSSLWRSESNVWCREKRNTRIEYLRNIWLHDIQEMGMCICLKCTWKPEALTVYQISFP